MSTWQCEYCHRPGKLHGTCRCQPKSSQALLKRLRTSRIVDVGFVLDPYTDHVVYHLRDGRGRDLFIEHICRFDGDAIPAQQTIIEVDFETYSRLR